MAQTPEPSRPALVLRIFNDDIDKPTLAELAIAQIKAHVNFFHTQEAALSAKRSAAQSTGASSLSDLAAHKIVDALCADDTTESLQILLSNCPATLLAKVLEGTALPYPAFRKLATVCRDDALAEKINGSLHGRDVDEWVLRNERVMRGILGKDQERMMVDLERDAGTIWPDSEVDGEVRVLTRKEPPKETLAVLGQRRKRNLRVLATTDAFKKRFDRLTGGALDGLDWNNCFVAGGMALATLMCTYDYLEKNSKNSDIDMYIYGLSPQEANEKIREIYDVWWKNLGPTKKTFCIKNSKTITFMSNYPEKRIQIILKYVASPAEVLLNFDLDQCAIGWNGSKVLLLPRCARALETGYTVFTTDLIHGHYLSNRRATQEKRVFKYADRGFGILFPASLLDASEIDFTARSSHPVPFGPAMSDDYYWGEPRPSAVPEPVKGAKVARRIAWLGSDFVRRFYIGATKGTALTKEYLSRNNDIDLDNLNDENQYDEREMIGCIEANEAQRYVPRAGYARINGKSQHRGQPGGRFGLKMFETFMRMVELWELDHKGMIFLDKDSFESTEYVEDGYDDLPKYDWSPSFRHETFAETVDHFNDNVFEQCQETIRRATDTSTGWNNGNTEYWSGYLTRRFRRIVTGNTLSEVMDKQITMPVWIPAVLDDYIATLTTPSNDEHRILIPAYNTRYKSRTTAIPPLPDKSRTGWRLRIWVIGNETMWARAHSREIDEVFEILWTLYHLAWTAGEDALRLPPRNADVDWEVACAFADRLERRPVPKVPEEEVGAGWIDQVEIQRWNEWLMDEPQRVMGRNYTTGHHWLFADTARLVPKEEWYWDGEVLEAERGVWTDAPEVQILEWADAKEATEEEGRGSPLRKRRRIGAAGSSYDDE